MYRQVPSIAPVIVYAVPSRIFAMPKSTIFGMTPLSSSRSRMLCGLRSRWMMPTECASSIASRMPVKIIPMSS